ncbi:MAG: hypothetical protein K5869_08875 [Saccharofermentans sp.]|nr:hypothetical protein [Saccharofermentans sp.]
MKKDNTGKGGSRLVGLMIVLAVIIVVASTIAFGYHGMSGNAQPDMFCGVQAAVPQA